MATEVRAGQYKQRISAATLVKTGNCRVVRVIVVTAGSGGNLQIYDDINANTATNLVLTEPGGDAAGTIYTPDCPMSNGIYVSPGTGQVVWVIWSL